MRHRKRRGKLNRSASHRKALLRSLAVSLFEHERITTTIAKAKAAAPLAERMITLAKNGSLSHRRRAIAVLQDRWIVKKLFEEIGPRYKDRHGGYTRVLRLSQWRLGDGGQKALLELVGPPEAPTAQLKAPVLSETESPAEPEKTEEEASAAEQPEPPAEPEAVEEPAEPEAEGQAKPEEPEKS